MLAWTLLPLANIALETNELDQATTLYDQCLPMMVDLADRHGVGAVLLGLGFTAQFRGETEEAQQYGSLARRKPTLERRAVARPILADFERSRRHPHLRSANRDDEPVSGEPKPVGGRVGKDGVCRRRGLARANQYLICPNLRR